MAINSKQKGSRVERGACKLLEDMYTWVEARRSQQFSGVRTDDTSADILTNIECIRWEVKGGYNKNEIHSTEVQEWIETAKEETPEGQQWAILWKKDRRDWVMITEMNGITILTNEIKKLIDLIINSYGFKPSTVTSS